ncbi:beta-barrel assembly-enhancing protease [Gammaproteobacteria bacterium]
MKIFLTLLIVAYLISSAALAYELPDLGEHSATILTPKEEKQMGKEFIQAVRSHLSILDDSIINDYIQNLGDKLAANSNAKNKKFNFFIVLNPAINAFAGPDANIGIYSGIFLATRSESELAAVMAHEIAHVSQHHMEHLIERAKNTQLTATAGALAALLVGIAAGANNVGTGAAMASMGGAQQHLLNFTKDKEIEADHIGMKTLYNSGFNPEAMPNFFERVQRLTYDYNNDQIPTFFLTHPATTDRIAESKDRANQYQKKQIKSQNTYNLLHARMQVLTLRHPTDATRYFQKQLAINKHQDETGATQYGYALALYKNQQLAQATTIIANLQKKYPNEVLFQMAAAQLAAANKQPDNAINILKTALSSHPDYYPLFIQYGQTLIEAKHSQAARDFLKSKIIQYSDNSDLSWLLAEAYAQNNQKADAYQAKARSYEIEGYYRQAGVLLQQALKVPKLSSTEQAIIHARIERLQHAERNL